MELNGTVSGVIYLEAANPDSHFDQTLLDLISAIGSIAALAYENARRMEWLESENERLKEESGVEHKMIGESRQMRAVYQFIGKVANQDATVLVWGESGTGKELVARAIHENSPRKYKPFVAINCAAISESLLESELFGHERGAFTGAQAQKKGKFEFAEGGTVFLDEIGEMAPLLQAKLLRALQEREIARVGGNKTIKIDIRVIAATNRDLKEMARQGKFREDLYYRLNVVSVRMPSLRDRPDDIPLLSAHFIRKFAQKTGRKIEGISAETRRCLLQYSWPGNVRELENAIERAVVLSSGTMLNPEDLPESVLETATPQEAANGSFHGELKGTKKQMVVRALEESNGNVTEAAKKLGVHPNYLHRLMNNLGIEKKRRTMSASA
jgi:Nif-specific regulatory protein